MARRVLALHGYSQNATMFHTKTGALRKHLRKENIELVYLDGPHILTKDQIHGDRGDDEVCRGWWTFDEEKNYFGVEESIAHITKSLQGESFEGICGFSQGATMIGILLAMHNKQHIPELEQIKYVIHSSGFVPLSSKVQETYFSELLAGETKIQLPSFHFYGEKDQLLPKERSIDFLKLYEGPESYEHPGGHFVPANGPPMRSVRKFVATQIEALS